MSIDRGVLYIVATPLGNLGKYLLQAGSFRSFEEADRLKASIQTVTQ
ncbi:MAG TPA: hypothetical protein VN418_09265 [Gammaproteobacteria bacterium]|nr:hypothetical protein [Gammaproteobacteria bacterium]